MTKYVFEVTTNFKWKRKTDGSIKENVLTIIAKTIIEACEKAEKLITPLSEDVAYHDVVCAERKDKIDG